MEQFYLETTIVVMALVLVVLILVLIKEVIELLMLVKDKRRRYGNKSRKVQKYSGTNR